MLIEFVFIITSTSHIWSTSSKACSETALRGSGADSAIETADCVLMKDDPMQLADAFAISKKTNRIVLQNIIFALGVKLIIQVLGVLGLANMWAAVFADVGVSIIAIFNSLRLMRK